VVEAESPPGAPLEARKAQAVVARSYFVAGSGGHRGFDFCDTTHCQFLREPPAAESPSSVAAQATRGLVVAYEGLPFPAMYSARCGGRTRTLAELGITARGYPYYAVDCDYCRSHAMEWKARLTPEEARCISRHTEQERLEIARKLGWSVVPSNRFTLTLQPDHAVVSGVGAGHGLGLCQYGAADLARKGADFPAILAHYFPNISILTIHETALAPSH
jgi:stage II sporulation protein D